MSIVEANQAANLWFFSKRFTYDMLKVNSKFKLVLCNKQQYRDCFLHKKENSIF